MHYLYLCAPLLDVSPEFFWDLPALCTGVVAGQHVDHKWSYFLPFLFKVIMSPFHKLGIKLLVALSQYLFANEVVQALHILLNLFEPPLAVLDVRADFS